MVEMYSPFDLFVDEYDRWFDENRTAYTLELQAIRAVKPRFMRGLEVGVGTGRFASKLGIQYGLDASHAMVKAARGRDILAIRGDAVNLPFADNSFDLVAMITVLCFMESPVAAIKEANRVLKRRGAIITAILDRDSPLGKVYQEKKKTSRFYNRANFLSTSEVVSMLENCGFLIDAVVQTIFPNQAKVIESGHGSGLFVVIKAQKIANA